MSTKIGAAFGRTIDLAIAAVRLIGVVFAVILAGHIVLTIFNANPENQITKFFADSSGGLALWFDGLFTPADPKLGLLINHGLAAVFWLAAAAIIARLLRSLR